jgi:hypothetical protein
LMQPSDSVLCKNIYNFNKNPKSGYKSGYKYDWFDRTEENIKKYSTSELKTMIATELNNCPWNINNDGTKKKDFTKL